MPLEFQCHAQTCVKIVLPQPHNLPNTKRIIVGKIFISQNMHWYKFATSIYIMKHIVTTTILTLIHKLMALKWLVNTNKIKRKENRNKTSMTLCPASEFNSGFEPRHYWVVVNQANNGAIRFSPLRNCNHVNCHNNGGYRATLHIRILLVG